MDKRIGGERPVKEHAVTSGKPLKKLSPAAQQYLDLLKAQKAGTLSSGDLLRLNNIKQRLTELEIDSAEVEEILIWLFKKDSCIAGMACPTCGKHESFVIEVPILLEFDDGGETLDELHCDRTWNDESFCRCPACSHEGTVNHFRAECPVYSTETADNSGTCLACVGTGLRHPRERSLVE